MTKTNQQKAKDFLINNGVIIVMTTQVLQGGCDMSLYEVGKNAARKYGIIESYQYHRREEDESAEF